MNKKKTRTDRVIFFSKDDLAGPHMLKKAEKLLNNAPDLSTADLNTLLEFHHIKQYFDNNLFLSEWTNDQKAAYIGQVDTNLNHIRKYFLNLEAALLTKEIKGLEYNNLKNFWNLFGYFEKYKKIDKIIFSQALIAFPSHIRYILKVKQLVKHYNHEIRAFLMANTNSAELLLSHYEENHIGSGSNYIFPKSLSDEDIRSMVTGYLDSEEPNLNYVALIRNSKHLKLTPKILLKAKRIAESLEKKYFTEANSTLVSVEGVLDMDETEPVIYGKTGNQTKVTYGGAFFDTLTDIQLFNVFSDVFLYTSEEGQIELVNKSVEMDGLEKAFMHSRNEYHTGWAFSQKDMLSLIQLETLNIYLIKKGRSIENLIEAFVQQFFREKYQMHNLRFSMPDSNASPADKIKLLAPDLESLLKQYKCYVVEGSIDHELLQIDSSPVFYSDIPSLVSKKYVFSSHELILTLQYHFFNPNGILSERGTRNSDKNLFQTLMTEKVIKSELEEYQQNYIDHLLKEQLVKINQSGDIEVSEPVLVYLAGRLRLNGSISYWSYPLGIRMKIDQLVGQGMLQCSGQLFTSEEMSYFNYYLNKKEFTNGHDLRNKYLHGSNNHEIEVQKNDYRYFLRIVILILLKLKDDLELNAALITK